MNIYIIHVTRLACCDFLSPRSPILIAQCQGPQFRSCLSDREAVVPPAGFFPAGRRRRPGSGSVPPAATAPDEAQLGGQFTLLIDGL